MVAAVRAESSNRVPRRSRSDPPHPNLWHRNLPHRNLPRRRNRRRSPRWASRLRSQPRSPAPGSRLRSPSSRRPCRTRSPGVTSSAALAPAAARRSPSRCPRGRAAGSRLSTDTHPPGCARARPHPRARGAGRPHGHTARRSSGLRCATVFGGVSQGPQTAALRRGVDILVACPGRLEDLIAQRHVRARPGSTSPCSTRPTTWPTSGSSRPCAGCSTRRLPMASGCCSRPRSTPASTGSCAVTCMIPPTHSVDPEPNQRSSRDRAPPVPLCRPADKAAVVAELASAASIARCCSPARSTAPASSPASSPSAGIPRRGAARQPVAAAARPQNLAAFSAARVRVLVATDIAARGIHVDDIALVVHVDPPEEHKAYLHRSGRTARAGAAGSVVTIATPEQARSVAALFRKANVRPNTATVRPGDPRTLALAGPTAERRLPPPVSSLAKPAPRASGKRPTTGSRQGHQPRGPRRVATRRSA